MSECTLELEDLLLEVFDSLEADGDDLVLPDYVARKLHGMVHLHRACSHRWSSDDFVDAKACVECAAQDDNQVSNQVDDADSGHIMDAQLGHHPQLVIESAGEDAAWSQPPTYNDHPELVIEEHPNLVIEECPNLVIEECPQLVIEEHPALVIEEHPELVIESDNDSDDIVPRSQWCLPSDRPEMIVEATPSVDIDAPALVVDHVSLLDMPELVLDGPAPCADRPQLVVELFSPVLASDSEDDGASDVADDFDDSESDDDEVVPPPRSASPSFVPLLPAIEEEDAETASAVSLAVDFKAPESMHSDDETVSSADFDLDNVQSLNHEYDEFFEFMHQALDEPSDVVVSDAVVEETPQPAPASPPTVAAKAPTSFSTRYSPGLDSTDDESSDDDEPLLLLRHRASPLLTRMAIESMPCPIALLGKELNTKSTPVRPSATRPAQLQLKDAPASPGPRPATAPSSHPINKNVTVRRSSAPAATTPRTPVTPTPRASHGSAATTPKRTPLSPRSTPTKSVSTPTKTVSTPSKTASTPTKTTAAPRSAPSATTPRKPATTPRAAVPRCATTPRQTPAPAPRSMPTTPRKTSAPTTPRSTPKATPTTPRSADQRHELVLKRREEMERREAAAREEAQKLKDERRAQIEARLQSERQARADLVKKRVHERDLHPARHTTVV